MSKGPRTDVIALAALATAAALGITLLVLRSPGGRASALAAVPADSFMIVSIDVVALAQSPLGEALMGELRGEAGARAGTLLGVDSITSTCGFDPLPQLRSIAIALPEGDGESAQGAARSAPEERGDFGVAATGTLTKDALAGCARAVIAKRGGEASTRQAGSFTVVSDARTPGGAEVAFRDGGPYLVGRGGWLARMIDAADGRVPSTLSGPAGAAGGGATHAGLRAGLATRDTDAEAVRATALLPHGVRERLQREMAPETDSPPGEGGKRGGNKAMEGVLGISAAAFGLHAGRAHEDSRFVAELRCDSESACDAVSTLILHTRLVWSGNLAYRLFGLGPLIDNLEVQRAGTPATSLFVRTHAPADDLARLLERALRPTPPRKEKATPIPRAPDETLPAQRGGEARGDAGR